VEEVNMSGFTLLLTWSGVGAFIAIVTHWSEVVCWTNKNAGLAGWVQAIGAIAAIAFAYVGIRKQIDHLEQARLSDHAERDRTRRAERLDRDIDMGEACVHVLSDAAVALQYVVRKLEQAQRGEALTDSPGERLEASAVALQSMLDSAVPSRLLEWILVARREVLYARVAWRQIARTARVDEARIRRANARVAATRTALTTVRSVLQDWKSERTSINL